MDSASTADFTEQLSELEIAALAASYGSLPAARGLLQRAGLPVIDLPMGDGRQSARLYWGTVAEELCNGLQQGGRVALLAVARRENPENSAFGGRQVARRLPGWRPAAAILTAVAVAVTLACLPIWTDDVPTIPAAQRSPETGQSVTKPVLPASEGSPEISASAALACASAPGFGIPAYTRSIRNAYDLAGGQATLGCATNNVVAVGGGAQQQFRTPSGRDAAIVAPDPAHAFALLPDDLRCLTDVLDGYTITVQRGVMDRPVEEVNGGRVIHLPGGALPGANAMIRAPNAAACVWVTPPFWRVYEGDFGGPTSRLGFPTSNVLACGDDTVQWFQHGVLRQRPDGSIVLDTSSPCKAPTTP
ncbi:effector-associated domain EAD1-containing protein [Pseudofrankia saprophytica]|uniref:effector-associated domain EAD1-containing protein n=1 Tax=Pseudofrankia saprophytica TaxID=298655 RepID=UPI000234CA2D|nr:effector-associated domain EAD1-containing protein [Pseudofrankia saprophytica]